MCQLSCGCAHMWFTMQAAKRKRDIWFVWKEIAFWNLWCILWAFHCSCSKSWWGTLPNDWYDFLLRLVRFFLRTQAMLTTEFCNDWYDFFVCEPKNMLFSEFCNDCSLSCSMQKHTMLAQDKQHRGAQASCRANSRLGCFTLDVLHSQVAHVN